MPSKDIEAPKQTNKEYNAELIKSLGIRSQQVQHLVNHNKGPEREQRWNPVRRHILQQHPDLDSKNQILLDCGEVFNNLDRLRKSELHGNRTKRKRGPEMCVVIDAAIIYDFVTRKGGLLGKHSSVYPTKRTTEGIRNFIREVQVQSSASGPYGDFMASLDSSILEKRVISVCKDFNAICKLKSNNQLNYSDGGLGAPQSSVDKKIERNLSDQRLKSKARFNTLFDELVRKRYEICKSDVPDTVREKAFDCMWNDFEFPEFTENFQLACEAQVLHALLDGIRVLFGKPKFSREEVSVVAATAFSRSPPNMRTAKWKNLAKRVLTEVM